MKDEFISRVGLWWQRHYNFLKKNSPTVINVMRLNGTLEQYLTDLDRDAQDMFGLLMKQYANLKVLPKNSRQRIKQNGFSR